MLKETIKSDLKLAFKSGDTAKRDTLRLLDSAIKNVEIEKNKRETGLSDEEVLEVVRRAVKQRQDSIKQYIEGGRGDLAEKESQELEILQKYLPRQLDEEQVRAKVQAIIGRTGAVSQNEFGKVMGMVMAEIKNEADGTLVSKIVKEELNK